MRWSPVIQSSVEGLAFVPHLAIGGPMPEADHLVYGAANVVENSNGRFYVLNSGDARVAAYDTAGEFIGTIGRQGEGPGEFSAPVGLAIALDDAVIILDAARFMLLKYDADGLFLRDIRLDSKLGFPVVVAATTDGDLVVEHRPMTGIADGADITLVLIDPESGASRHVHSTQRRSRSRFRRYATTSAAFDQSRTHSLRRPRGRRDRGAYYSGTAPSTR